MISFIMKICNNRVKKRGNEHIIFYDQKIRGCTTLSLNKFSLISFDNALSYKSITRIDKYFFSYKIHFKYFLVINDCLKITKIRRWQMFYALYLKLQPSVIVGDINRWQLMAVVVSLCEHIQVKKTYLQVKMIKWSGVILSTLCVIRKKIIHFGAHLQSCLTVHDYLSLREK